MARGGYRLGIALIVVLAIGLGWLLLDRPWQAPTPAATAPPATSGPSDLHSAVDLSPDSRGQERRQMVESQIKRRGVSDTAVLATMEAVPRHLFVPADMLAVAYGDHPLPIGHGQTISQPYIVAWMTELLALKPGARVLEVGTGSGYQAAILGQMGMEVYTIEIVEALATQATERLAEMGYETITVRHGDGYYGWEEQAPFEAILVTCAPDHIPPPLVQQLADGGRMVLPVGPPGGYQSLWLVEKQGDQVRTTEMGGVMFVPLTGEH
ncbi:MAG: protein-L-isoaspartate(D-aspartate) O-methyltransferase [Anaerolineae bacterium]|nr:protein-L-isoaspartate(D-aspartate) O-methyltransferase [Anaerolineae bacterium]